MRSTIQKETSKVTLTEAFCTNRLYRRASIVALVQIIFHELTGINVVGMYSNTILHEITAGSAIDPRIGAIILGTVSVIGGLASFKVLKTWGRRPLLIFGYVGISMCHIAIGFLTIYKVDIANLCCLCLFMFLYQITTGQITWIYTVEVCVDVSLGVSFYTLWFVVLILLLGSQPLMATALGPQGVFFIFAGCCAVAAVFCYLEIRETKDLTDKEKKSLFVPKDLVTPD